MIWEQTKFGLSVCDQFRAVFIGEEITCFVPNSFVYVIQ